MSIINGIKVIINNTVIVQVLIQEVTYAYNIKIIISILVKEDEGFLSR